MTLDAKQRETLRETLVKRHAALLAELADDAARLRSQPFAALVGETPDSADEAFADTMVDTEQAAQSRDLAEMREVETALARFDMGRYGACKECGVDIPFARLSANPSAVRCANCQERHESIQGGGRTATL